MTMPLTPPVFVKASTVTLEYPYVSPTIQLTLPAPADDNVERLSQLRIQTETRGGDLIIYRKDTWPKDDELALTFTGITTEQRQGLQRFLKESLGKFCKYTDHLSLVWKIIITNPDTQIVQDHNNRHTVNLTLNGNLQSWP